MSCIRREIPAYGHFPHGGAVQADGITSDNTVGYSSATIKAEQFYMIGVQFADVAKDGTQADFNTFFQCNCEPGYYGDDGAQGMHGAPMIQVLQANGKNYSYYYYINDADDGTERYDLTGWSDDYGNLVGNDALMPLSKGFWFKSMKDGSVTCSGQICAIDEFVRTVPANQFEIVANPFPIGLNLNAPTTSGFTPGYYGDDGAQGMHGAPMIQVLQENGKNYSYYYYIDDADDGTERYDLTGWCDDYGNLVEDTQVGVGAAFWIKSETAGKFVFSLK